MVENKPDNYKIVRAIKQRICVEGACQANPKFGIYSSGAFYSMLSSLYVSATFDLSQFGGDWLPSIKSDQAVQSLFNHVAHSDIGIIGDMWGQ